MSHRLPILLEPDEIAAIRAAAHAYPTGDPEAMDAEITRGYLEDAP